jgi:hypothetical protein
MLMPALTPFGDRRAAPPALVKIAAPLHCRVVRRSYGMATHAVDAATAAAAARPVRTAPSM